MRYFRSNDDWESFHLKFLLYYLVRFRIKDERLYSLSIFRTLIVSILIIYLDKHSIIVSRYSHFH